MHSFVRRLPFDHTLVFVPARCIMRLLLLVQQATQFFRRGGNLEVVEYSEIDPAEAEARHERGQLKYNWANVCMQFFTVEWLAAAAEYLQTHPKRAICSC